MRQGITRREMLLGNLAALLGGMVAVLFGPWLRRGRPAPNCPAPQAPVDHTRCYGYTQDPLNQVTTYTYDAGGRLLCVADPALGSVTTYTYTCEGGGHLYRPEQEA